MRYFISNKSWVLAFHQYYIFKICHCFNLNLFTNYNINIEQFIEYLIAYKHSSQQGERAIFIDDSINLSICPSDITCRSHIFCTFGPMWLIRHHQKNPYVKGLQWLRTKSLHLRLRSYYCLQIVYKETLNALIQKCLFVFVKMENK